MRSFFNSFFVFFKVFLNMVAPLAAVFLPISRKNEAILRRGGANRRKSALRIRVISLPTSETSLPAVAIQTAKPIAEPR